MTGKWKSKPKKVIETSLGKAPTDAQKGPDLSHLRKPIITSIYNIKQIFSLFQSSTAEVQDYISYECDILFECRVCRTIFRSLANFILHKRDYCREKWQFGGGNNEAGFVINDDLKTSDEESRCTTPTGEADNVDSANDGKKTLLPIIDKLLKKQKVQIMAKETLNEDLSKAEHSDDDVIFVSEESNIVLQKIDGSETAVFQTAVKDCEKLEESKEGLMKSEILEIHGILDNNQAVLGSTGKICPVETSKVSNPIFPKQNLVCSECNFSFSTEKTLIHHIKYKHNKTCLIFPCPDCKESFSDAWSVYRHLYKVHKRTTAQVKRMRYLVHSSKIRREQEPEKKKRKLNVEDENEENQWMNNFEGDKDFQMCGGCGKRFERKAALHSHSQMCTKRIAVCNSIKNVKVVKNDKKEKVENNEVKLKGAAKRKQHVPTVVRCAFEEKANEDSKVVDENISKEVVKDVNEEIKEIEVDKACESEECIKQDIKPGKPPPVTITKFLDPDVTITRHDENETDSDPIPYLPEIEIFTISDDSSGTETSEKPKRKKTLNVDPKVKISDEFKEYVNDEEDFGFLSQAMTHINKNELKCITCGMSFMSLYMLLRHMSLHYSWFRFQCSKCNFMSFHKYDCTTHAYNRHSTPSNLMDSTVLPIPSWKVLCSSHDFKAMTEVDVENQPDLGEKTMPRLMKIDEKVQENGIENSETIIVEDDEMPDICAGSTFADTVILSDEEKKDDGITDEKKTVTKAGPSNFANSRPIRNRTKSVKTVQNDFIYDMAKVLKFNDNSGKNKKIKKTVSKS